MNKRGAGGGPGRHGIKPNRDSAYGRYPCDFISLVCAQIPTNSVTGASGFNRLISR